MSCHRIRLPAPWQVTCARLQSPIGAPQIKLRFGRNFQSPSGLNEQARLALEIQLLEPLSLTVTLNGEPCALQRQSEREYLVPFHFNRLRPTNRIEIELVCDASSRASCVDSSLSPEVRFGDHYLNSVSLRIE